MLKQLLSLCHGRDARVMAPNVSQSSPSTPPDRAEEMIRLLASIDKRLEKVEHCVGHSTYGGRGHYVKIMNATNN